MLPETVSNFSSYFNDFEGATVCNIKATDLYAPPLMTNEGYSYGYCNSRVALLKALSEGGRHGFDTPYFPNGVYTFPSARWIDTNRILQAATIGGSPSRRHVQYSTVSKVLSSSVTKTPR